MQGLFYIFVPVLLGAVFYLAWKAEQKRREEFSTWALSNNWHYDHRKNASLRHRYAFLNRLQIGHNRSASHHLEGKWGETDAIAFCFNYTTGSGKHQQHHSLGVVLIEVEEFFPELRICPENMLNRFGQFLGFEDIDLESVEFSNAFTVRSSDKKLAYDFCNTDMMTYLLGFRSTALELEGNTMALFVDRYLKPQDVEDMLTHLVEIRRRMPDYLFKQ
ncbi:MAG: DUF3137 domain-containing protein [Planctomycetota bacterium]|nr:DUF3137 domain-containing protein [Planctomycetota bacterium]MDA1114597.1 DUF3137 domain-containing protein [Planctomycetota bacterium]